MISQVSQSEKQASLIYGQSKVGKSWLAKQCFYPKAFKIVIDCASFAALVTSVDVVKVLEEYLTMQYKRAIMHGSSSVIILDNINAICAAITKDSQPTLLDRIRTEKFSQMTTRWIEDQEVTLVCICRHFT